MIVRHGEAVSNAEDLVAGHLGCRGLTERGRPQVEALAERLGRTGELEGASALYSSVLRRAVETAEILLPGARRVAYEATCSSASATPARRTGSAGPSATSATGAACPARTPSGPSRLVARAGSSSSTGPRTPSIALAEAHPGELVVVSGHGGVIDASLVRFLGLPAHGGLVRLFPDNASMTEWAFTGSSWWLVRFNDAAHLDPHRPEDPAGLRIVAPGWVRREEPDLRRARLEGARRPQQA